MSTIYSTKIRKLLSLCWRKSAIIICPFKPIPYAIWNSRRSTMRDWISPVSSNWLLRLTAENLIEILTSKNKYSICWKQRPTKARKNWWQSSTFYCLRKCRLSFWPPSSPMSVKYVLKTICAKFTGFSIPKICWFDTVIFGTGLQNPNFRPNNFSTPAIICPTVWHWSNWKMGGKLVDILLTL